jgi:uncharacterized membrane protein
MLQVLPMTSRRANGNVRPRISQGFHAMTLTPLLETPPAIVVHATAAMAAFVLGIAQFAAPKGTIPHRTVGWIWVGLMLAVSASSFLVHEIRLWGPWSPIHLLSIFTLASLPLAVWAAHRHRVAAHRRAMTSIFLGALLIAGAFTLLPGRIMHAVVFGPGPAAAGGGSASR